ncbi:MAG: DUF1513 domain-containing protein [Nannocystaceae bacterium]|nr:DUF1513 domain-containing protein [bacterium]
MSARLEPVLRRRVVLGGGCAWLVASAGCDEQPTAAAGLFASAQGSEEGAYELVVADGRSIRARFASAHRGHGLAVHPANPQRVVMFARRPGTVGLVADARSGETVARFEAPQGRHQSGHGCFGADGSALFVVEAEVGSGRGFIAVLDAETFERRGEFETGGLGPHEVALMPDGVTLAVANGGLVSAPGGRDPINLDTMQSSLVYLDSGSGRQLGVHGVPEPKASLRHLAVADDGTVAVAMQIQRDALDDAQPRPLIAVQRPGEPLRPFDDGLEMGTAMEDYAGAVAVDSVTRTAALTSPRGNLVGYWDLDTGALKGAQTFADVSGVGLSSDGAAFILTGAGGQVRRTESYALEELSEARRQFGDVRWDNHLVVLPV